MTDVKIIRMPVTDEYGGKFPDAVVAIWDGAANTQLSFKTEGDKYSFKNDGFALLTYRLSFWYDEQKRLAGIRSRPLIREINGVDTKVFTVDLEADELANLLDS